MNPDKVVRFKTNVLLKNIIGKDLINNDNIAILELVKNGLDARANHIFIEFYNLIDNDDFTSDYFSENSSRIIIQDDGSGMSLEDIENKWLNIAYSEKKILKDRGSENFAGAKGVGRFSCDRLGQYLDLYTRKPHQNIVHLFINWNDFEKEDARDLTIQDIDIKIEILSEEDFSPRFKKKFHQGTILEMSKLRSQWISRTLSNAISYDLTKLNNLKQYLEKLVSPNKVYEKNHAEIALIIPEIVEYEKMLQPIERVNGVIQNKIFEQLDFATTLIEAEISKDGKIVCTSLMDKGRKVFEIKEYNVDYRHLKDVKIVLYYLNTYAKAFFTKKTGIRAVNFGSIFLFIDGFRVNPLGDFGNDWLRLDQRKGQGYARFLGTRELTGRIEINDKFHKIKIVSSREGIVADDTSREIADVSKYDGFYYKTHKRLEKYVVDGLDWDKVKNPAAIEKAVEKYGSAVPEKYSLSSDEKDIKIINSMVSIVCQDTKPENIISLYINDSLLNQLNEEKAFVGRERLQKLVSEYNINIIDEDEHHHVVKLLEEAEKKLDILDKKVKIEEQKNLYLLASKNISVNYTRDLIHHIKLMTNEINGHISLLIKAIAEDKFKKRDVIQRLNKIKINADKTQKISELMTIAGFRAQTEKQKFNLPQFIKEYLTSPQALGPAFKKYEINVFGEYVGFWVYSSIFELSMILDNLLSNAEKAGATIVQVDIINKTQDSCIIDFSDNGNGVPTELLSNPEQMFSLGVTTTTGSGIGLYSVRELLSKISYIDTTISFVGNGSILNGATFQLTFIKKEA